MDGQVRINVVLRDGSERLELAGQGNGPISAFMQILKQRGFDFKLTDYVEHTLAASGDALAAAYIEISFGEQLHWGVGIDGDIATASLKALISAVNRVNRG